MWLLLKTAGSDILSQPRCYPRQQQLFRVGKQLSTLWGYVLFCVTQSPPFLMPPSLWGWTPIADYKYLLWCFSESGEILFWNPVTIKRGIIFKWEGSGTPILGPYHSLIYITYWSLFHLSLQHLVNLILGFMCSAHLSCYSLNFLQYVESTV